MQKYSLQKEGREMSRKETAFFVSRPRRLTELNASHLPESEHPFQIVADVVLSAMDYENFAEDLLVDREFLEPYAELCGKGAIYRCVFVHRRGYKDGILVVPERGYFVSCAAYLSDGVKG